MINVLYTFDIYSIKVCWSYGCNFYLIYEGTISKSLNVVSFQHSVRDYHAQQTPSSLFSKFWASEKLRHLSCNSWVCSIDFQTLHAFQLPTSPKDVLDHQPHLSQRVALGPFLFPDRHLSSSHPTGPFFIPLLLSFPFDVRTQFSSIL